MKKTLVTLLLVVVFTLVFTGTSVMLAQNSTAVETLAQQLAGSEGQYGVVEEDVQFANEGQTIVGTLAKPDTEGVYPIILLFHGFTGTRNELPVLNTDNEFMYSRTARLLAERGYASLRIDFRGSGESEGNWEDTTFSGQISDAYAALDFVTTLDSIDTEQIGVIGLSQGGLVAASIADDPRIGSVVLWSPVANPPDTYGTIVGKETIVSGLASGGEAVNMTLPWGAEISLKTGFFEDLYNIDPIAEITAYSRPLMVIVGSRDDTVTPQPYYGQAYINYHEGDEMLVVVDGDHVFDILMTGPEVMDEAVFWSLAWFESTL